MRVLITGSRDWEGVHGAHRIQMILDILLALCDVLGSKLTIVHGDGPGADQLVDAWALRRQDSGVTVERHPADWRMGKSAGPIRNMRMIDSRPDMTIGFLKDNSRGASGTLELSRQAHIPTFTVMWDQVE